MVWEGPWRSIRVSQKGETEYGGLALASLGNFSRHLGKKVVPSCPVPGPEVIRAGGCGPDRDSQLEELVGSGDLGLARVGTTGVLP